LAKAPRTLPAIAACSSGGRSAKAVLACSAFRSRSKVFGTPLERAFIASIASITAEKTISCIKSVADFFMTPL
jgi:hypothetical protein